MSPDLEIPDLEALRAQFPPRTWHRGSALWRRGAVVSLDEVTGRNVWLAAVRGSASEPYGVFLHVEGGGQWTSTCSCPAFDPCKHTVAVWLEVLARANATAPGAQEEDDDDDEQAPIEVKASLAAMGSWLSGARRASRESRPEDVRRPVEAGQYAVLYGLSIECRGRHDRPAPTLRAYSSRRRKNGEWGKPKKIDLEYSSSGLKASKSVTLEDELLWMRLTKLSPDQWRHRSAPGFSADSNGVRLFAEFIDTGRVFFHSPDTGMLSRGAPRSGHVLWDVQQDGTQQLQVRLLGEDGSPTGPVVTPIPLATPYYFDIEAREVGPLEVPIPADTLASLVTAPPLDPRAVESLDDATLDAFEALGLPLPRVQHWEEIVGVRPRPRLTLELGERGAGLEALQVSAFFDYGQVSIPVDPANEAPSLRLSKDDVIYEVARDLEVERAAFEAIGPLQSAIDGSSGRRLEGRVDGLNAKVDVFGQLLPALREAEWAVEFGPRLQAQLVEPDDWYVDAQAEEGEDWFSLELGIEVGGERVNILPAVVRALRGSDVMGGQPKRGRGIEVALDDGRLVVLPAERLARVIDVLVELYDDKALDEGRLRLSLVDAGRTLDLEDFTWRGASRLRKMADQLRRRTPLPKIAVPSSLEAELRAYQREGLHWLGFLRTHGMGGVLADDMGLGKTIQALAHILVEKRARRLEHPALVVAPRSAIHNWRVEAERFAPSLRVGVYHGPGRNALLDERLDLVVTTYALLHRDAAVTQKAWHLVILDEAQAIKTPTTAVSVAARRLDTKQRLCLTGTPMENHLGDLWSLFAFVSPGLLGTKKAFDAAYRRPIEGGDADRLAALSARIAPFMLRRTKAQVLSDLPPKTEQVLSIPMAQAQRDLYESVRLAMEKRVREALVAKGVARSQIVVLDALLKLRQACCHPKLVKVAAAKKAKNHSAKTARLLEILEELKEAGRRALVFSQFTSMLDLLRPLLDERGIRHQSITGRTRKRQEVVDAFQAGEYDVLLISLKAGGTALTLTAADTVIHYDPWWNPAVEAQATDRAYRIGQTQPVTVMKLVCEGSVEERVLQLQARKATLTRALQQGAERRSQGGLALDAEDVALMLAPLGSAE